MMIAVHNEVATDRRMRTEPASSEYERTERLAEIEQALGHVSLRINAQHAREQSLRDAAHDLRIIRQQLEGLLEECVSRYGWNIDQQLAQSALRAPRRQLQLVLETDQAMPIEHLRAHFKHAMLRAIDTVILLEA